MASIAGRKEALRRLGILMQESFNPDQTVMEPPPTEAPQRSDAALGASPLGLQDALNFGAPGSAGAVPPKPAKAMPPPEGPQYDKAGNLIVKPKLGIGK